MGRGTWDVSNWYVSNRLTLSVLNEWAWHKKQTGIGVVPKSRDEQRVNTITINRIYNRPGAEACTKTYFMFVPSVRQHRWNS